MKDWWVQSLTRKIAIALTLAALPFTLSNCGGGADSITVEESATTDELALQRGVEDSEAGSEFEAGSAAFADRVVVQSAEMTIKSDSVSLTHGRVKTIALAFEGYLVDADNEMTAFRIPAKHFDAALDSVATLGEVLDRKISGKDVTDNYRDLNVRLENAIQTRERYLALLSQANGITEMLKLERELERLNGKIEALKGQLQQLGHVAVYATITVKTKTPTRRGVIGEVAYQMYRGVSWLFVRD